MSDSPARRAADPAWAVFGQAHATVYPERSTISAQGDPATHVFLIEDGRAALIRSAADGREIILGFREAGSALGTMPAILGRVHPASIVTLSVARIRTLPAGMFLDALGRDAGLSGQIHRLHALAIEESGRRIAGLAFDSVRQRLEAYLRELAGTSRTSVRLPLDQPDLARYLATSRPYVNHLLRELENDGILLRSKGWYVVDPRRLSDG